MPPSQLHGHREDRGVQLLVVEDMTRPAIRYRASRRGVLEGSPHAQCRGQRALVSDHDDGVVLAQRDLRIESATEPPRRRRHRDEHRLHVGRRLRDHAEDVGGRRLLLQRLGKILVARLQLLEQAHVLDGDDRLVGKAGDQLDLPLRERTDTEPVEGEDSDQASLSDHGNRQQRAEAESLPEIPPLVLRVREDVGDMDGSTLHGGPARPGASPRSEGIAPPGDA